VQKRKRHKSVIATLLLTLSLCALVGLAINSSFQTGSRQSNRAGLTPEVYMANALPRLSEAAKSYPTGVADQPEKSGLPNIEGIPLTATPTGRSTLSVALANKSETVETTTRLDYSDQALKQILSNELQKPGVKPQFPSSNPIANNLLPLDYSYNPIAAPTITFKIFEQVLAEGHSPALPEAAAMYAVCQRQYCDPALALAFFDQESSLGNRGVAVQTKSVGNIRCKPPGPCYDTENNGSFQSYASWTEGLEAWAVLLRDTYLIKWKLATPEQIIPRYAPGEQSIEYIKGVKAKVNNLRLRGRLRL